MSLLDPPAWAAAAAKECRNLHTFPVLAGDDGGRDVVLSSPIIMYDHPGGRPGEPRRPARRGRDRRDPHAAHADPDRRGEARGTGHRPEGQGDRGPGRRPCRRRCSPGCTAPCARCARWPGRERRRLEPLATGRGGTRARTARCRRSDAVVVDCARGQRAAARGAGTDAHDMFLAGPRGSRPSCSSRRRPARGRRAGRRPGADLHQWYGRYHYSAPATTAPDRVPRHEAVVPPEVESARRNPSPPSRSSATRSRRSTSCGSPRA